MGYPRTNNKTATDRKTHAVATATAPGVTGRRIRILQIVVSYSAAPSAGAKFQLLSGSTLKLDLSIPAAGVTPIPLGDGIQSEINSDGTPQDITGVLDDGGASVIGTVNLVFAYE